MAGFCNNAAIDKMLEDEAVAAAARTESGSLWSQSSQCDNCTAIGTIITNKFLQANRDSVLDWALGLCGKMSSFSDACQSIVLTYFNEGYDYSKTNLNADSICHMSGSCALKFHRHEKPVAKVDPSALVAAAEAAKDEDIPCELCKQLVQHLK